MTDLTDDLQFLIDEPVNAVHFVMDSVELHFNGSYVRLLTNPTVTSAQDTWTFPDTGSRDALCGLIEHEVRAIRANLDGEFRIELSGDVVLTAPLTAAFAVGPEVLHFHNRLTGQTQWR